MKLYLILITIILFCIAATVTASATGSYCYQESATVPNQTGIDGNCGLRYTGLYNAYLVSEDAGTLLINYSKPASESDAIWKIKTGSFDSPYIINLTILESCFQFNSSNLSLNVSMSLRTFTYSCYNGTWVTLHSFTYSPLWYNFGGNVNTGYYSKLYDGNWDTNAAPYHTSGWIFVDAGPKVVLFEEAIYWTNPVINLNTSIGYSTIQSAINASETLNGHTIIVDNGTYFGHILTNKSITLIGVGTTILTNNVTNGYIRLFGNITLRNFIIKCCG